MKALLRSGVRFFIVGLAVGTATAGIACSPASQSPPSGSGAAGRDQAPQYGGLLHVPARPTFEGKDPYRGATGSSVTLKTKPVYEPLVVEQIQIDTPRSGNPVMPWLAEKWQQQDPTTFLFSLRKGVHFQDGKEMTAADVVFSFSYFLDPDKKYRNTNPLRGALQNVEATGPHEVKITLKTAVPDFVGDVLTEDFKVLPKHVIDRGDSFDDVVNGTGPYKMVSLDNLRGLSFERNPNYWDKGRPYLDGIVVHKGLDDSGMIAAMRTAQLDVYTPGLQPQLDQLKSVNPDVRSASFGETFANTVFLRQDRPPFNDVRVRRALHLGLDRQKIIQIGLWGNGMLVPPSAQPDTKWAIPQEELAKMPGYDPATKQQDIAEAKRLLAEAGYPRGFKLDLSYLPSLSSSSSMAEPMANAWSTDLGLEVSLKPFESATFEARRRDGQFDAMLTTTTGEFPLSTFQDYYYSKGNYAKFGLADPKLDELNIAAQTATDSQRRVELVRQLQKLVLDNSYAIGVVERIAFTSWQPWIRDYLPSSGAQVNPYYTPAITWLDQEMLPPHRRGEKLPF